MSTQSAAIIFNVISIFVLNSHVLKALGVHYNRMYSHLNRVISLFIAIGILYLSMAMLAHTEVVFSKQLGSSSSAVWISVLLSLGLFVNKMAHKSLKERIFWVPITALMLFTSATVAISA